MLRDADEHDESQHTNISLEDDKGNHSPRGGGFVKGLRTLLADPFFLLLYVPENGSKMQVIQPANDPNHRPRMMEKMNETNSIPSFYYTLSHLWGLTENNRYLWHEIGDHVNDEQGQPMKPVSMRPEKRDPLLTLLRNHPDSYWWIDVLCARTDTPLDIMGDVYACCLECIAMIDCEPSLIPKIHTTSYAVEECRELERKLLRPPTYQELHQTKAPQLIEHLSTFLQSQWWQRVWTWQEMALPQGFVRFMAETHTRQLKTSSLTLEKLLYFLSIGDIIKISLARNSESVYDNDLQMDVYALERMTDRAISSFNHIDLSGRSKNWLPRVEEENLRIICSFSSLMISNRRCYDPCDYVYGMLGMLKIKIPRMDDPNDVWRHFLSELDNLSRPRYGGRWMDLADKLDLREVKNIGEVYNKLCEHYHGIE